MNNSRYTFGNTETAAKRLEEMAGFFNPPAEEWIKKYIKTPVKTALDLGCGPGFSAHMLRRALLPAAVFGFDKSNEFLELAKDRFSQCAFLNHNITVVPFPVKADVMYCRFLLSHLKDSIALINMWLGELLAGGMLFIDELEGINTDVPVFQKYLEINESLVKSQGAGLFIGETLSKGDYKAEVLSNELTPMPVASWRAASWFYPNTVTIWEKEKHVRDNFSQVMREKISREIYNILRAKDSSVKSLWKMRRMVLRKRGY